MRYIHLRQYGVEAIDFQPDAYGTPGLGDVADFGVTGLVAVLRPGITHAPHRWSDTDIY